MKPDPLLERARSFDRQALEAMYNQLYPSVYRYIHFRLEDEETCEDICAEAFTRFLQALRHKGRDIQDARGWLLGTASNLIHDFYRRKYHRPEEDLESHEDLSDGQMPEMALERHARRQDLREAIRELTPDQQHVLALRFSQESSLEETARLVGKSVNAVKVLQYRALAALRRRIAERSSE